MKFSVPMALEDFVPVVLAGVAFFVLGDVLTRGHAEARRLAWVGAALVTLGGTSKATWKLIMALSEGTRDVVVLDQGLFFLLASGFVCLSAAYLAARRPAAHPQRVALALVVPLVTLCVVLLVREVRAYRIILIAAVALASSTTLIVAALEARRRGALLAALLIAMYLLASYALQALARQERSVGQQWMAQIINTTGALSLLLGSLRLRRHVGTPQAGIRSAESPAAP